MGMKSKGAFERLIQLIKLHKIDFVAIQEVDRLSFLKISSILTMSFSVLTARYGVFGDLVLIASLILRVGNKLPSAAIPRGMMTYSDLLWSVQGLNLTREGNSRGN